MRFTHARALSQDCIAESARDLNYTLMCLHTTRHAPYPLCAGERVHATPRTAQPLPTTGVANAQRAFALSPSRPPHGMLEEGRGGDSTGA